MLHCGHALHTAPRTSGPSLESLLGKGLTIHRLNHNNPDNSTESKTARNDTGDTRVEFSRI